MRFKLVKTRSRTRRDRPRRNNRPRRGPRNRDQGDVMNGLMMVWVVEIPTFDGKNNPDTFLE